MGADTAKATASGAAGGSKLGGWGALAGAGLGAIGSIIGGNSAKKAAASSGKWGLISQIMQQQWEEKRAKNAHQWEIEDLHKAGLNPILSAGGQGAATGSIGGINYDSSGISSAGSIMATGLAGAGDSAVENYLKSKRVENETLTTKANAAKTLEEAGLLNKYGSGKMEAEIKKLISETLQSGENTRGQKLINDTMDNGLTTAKKASKAAETITDKVIDNIIEPWWLKQIRGKRRKDRLEGSWAARKKSLGM